MRDVDWAPFSSITHMEILHGAYRTRNPNALFLMRDSSFLDQVPPTHLENFAATNTRDKVGLAVLKEKIKQRFPAEQVGVHVTYDVLW